MEVIAQKLDRLAEMQAARDMFLTELQARIDQVMTPEIKAEITRIHDETSPRIDAMNADVETLQEEIKADVLAAGSTAKGKYLMAVWNKGRVSWDSKKLDGMMALIPALSEARKEGEPTVSFRLVK